MIIATILRDNLDAGANAKNVSSAVSAPTKL